MNILTYRNAVRIARALQEPLSENAGSEYARGQIELIADLFSIDMASRENIERDIANVRNIYDD
jgi:hypothetical protein